MKYIHFSIFLLFLFSRFNAHLLSDCTSLQNIQTNNSFANYQLSQNINCANFTFLPIGDTASPFQGTLDGNGFMIGNITISSNNNYTALFGYGQNCNVQNLILKNFKINSTGSQFTAALFGWCIECNISQITLTSDMSTNNSIQGNSYTAGLAGFAGVNTVIRNCSLENTFVSGGTFVGGITGDLQTSSMLDCFNNGFLNFPNANIVNGNLGVGGLIGVTTGAYLVTRCGVLRGRIIGSENTGGAIGFIQATVTLDMLYGAIFSQIFVRNQVTITCKDVFCGGLAGRVYHINRPSTLDTENITNVYSSANVTGTTNVGGLVGSICFNNSTNLAIFISNSFSNSFVSSSNTSTGSIIGSVANSSSSYGLSFTQVYFDNQTSSFPGIGSGSSTDTTVVTGFPSNNLLSTVRQTFDQCLIWSNLSLRIEPNITLIPPLLCPSTFIPTTQIPTTNLPSTEIPTTSLPTTRAPTTQIPTTNLPTTQIPTTNTPTTQIPTTNLPSTQIPTTNLPTTRVPTTQIPTTNLPTTQIPTTNLPTTRVPTTQIPTTNLPTTNVPSTNLPTTQSPSISLPSTEFPTTQTPITNVPTSQILTSLLSTTNSPTTQFSSTQTPSTNFPQTNKSTTQYSTSIQTTSISSSLSPSNFSQTNFQITTSQSCFYQVPNCSFCSQNPPQFDANQFNISCSLIGEVYVWIFKNKTSDTIFNNFTITLNGTTTFFEGNFTQTSNGKLIFVFDPLSSQNRSSSFSSLNVSGCVSLNGTVEIVLDVQPQQGSSSFQIISYNCSQQTSLSDSQIIVSPIYKNGECDSISSQTINSQNSISVSLSTSLGSKCGGRNIGLIVGLSVGIPIGLTLISLALVFISRKIAKRRAEKYLENYEMQRPNFEDNKVFKEKTVWKENN